MHSSRRWVFNGTAAISLLLLVATVCMWVRSYWRDDSIVTKYGTRQSWISSELGTVRFQRGPNQHAELVGTEWYSWSVFPDGAIVANYPNRTVDWRMAGFAWLEGDSRIGFALRHEPPPLPYLAVIIPYWSLTTIFAAISVIELRAILRYRRRARYALCAFCGYDLRATPDRCPECGQIVGKPI